MNNKPIEITLDEWREIIEVPAVREAWGLYDETPEEFAGRVYGVKFDFMSGSPGYVGDLYILHGDAICGHPVTLLRDNDGKLEIEEYDY